LKQLNEKFKINDALSFIDLKTNSSPIDASRRTFNRNLYNRPSVQQNIPLRREFFPASSYILVIDFLLAFLLACFPGKQLHRSLK
jgi:hypothetical protein